MSKDTLEGHAALSTASGVVKFLLRHTRVDTIKYGRMTLKLGWYISLWSEKEQRGYGSAFMSEDEFQKLKDTADGPVTFRHTTMVF